MDVLPNEEEAMVQRAVAEFLEAESTPAVVRAAETRPGRYSPELWSRVAELGWLGLCLPEAYGDEGLPLGYLGLLLEEVGRRLAPIPVLQTMVPALLLSRHGTPAQRALLPLVARGTLLMTYAVQEADGRWFSGGGRTTGRIEGSMLILSGAKAFVGAFQQAAQCLVAFSIGLDEVSLALVDTGASGIRHEALITTAGDAEGIVTFDEVRVPLAHMVGTPGGGRLILDELKDLASAFAAALMVGAAQEATARAIEYAKERHAFGQPIGAFQAIQHLCADMVIGVDGAQLLTREAIARLARGLPAAVEVSQAKSFANEKCLMACRAAQQIHGGIGFIVDFDQQLWYRRVTSWSLRCGTVMEHRRRIAIALLDSPGEVRLGRELLM